MIGTRVTLDPNKHWGDGEFEIISDPIGVNDREGAPYGGLGFVWVRPTNLRWGVKGFIVVPVIDTMEVKDEGTDVHADDGA